MSRSVSVPHDAVAVAYLHHDAEPDPEPSDDEDADDIGVDCEQDAQDWYEEVRETLAYASRKRFPSMTAELVWRGREDLTVAHNWHADVGLSQYGDIIAVWIAPRLDPHRDPSVLAEHWMGVIAATWATWVSSWAPGEVLERIGVMSNGETVYRRMGAGA